MNGKQARRARALAMGEAKRRHLWQEGRGYLFSGFRGFLRKLAAKISPKKKAEYDTLIGRWYRRNVKKWTHDAYAASHNSDLAALAAARSKARRARVREQREKMEIISNTGTNRSEQVSPE